jgi:ubiquinone/menaquinone biosynthesis C-methylase UbiE/uncharacterized protein YbaR (Trm112 family)
MRLALLSLLVCPACHQGGLGLAVTARDAREIRAGLLFCSHCKARYSIADGIVDLLDNPPEAILREQQGWLTLLGETTPELDAQMLQLPYFDHEHWWPHAANFDGLMEHVCLDGKRVLDVGSGRAWSARWLLRHGAVEVIATDILRQKYIGLETADLFFEADSVYFERVLCDMETMPFASAGFDAVFSTASIHHALDLQRTFKELNRMLRPGGLVLLTNEPVRPYSYPVDLSDSAEVVAGINEHIYTIEEWLEAAEAAGFDVRLYISRWVERAYDKGRLDQVLVVRPSYDYLPRLLGSSIGRRLLDWQPLLFNAYHDYGLPLVAIARKQQELSDSLLASGDAPTPQDTTLLKHVPLSPLRSFTRLARRNPAFQGIVLRVIASVIGQCLSTIRNPIGALRSWRAATSGSLPFDDRIAQHVLRGLYPIERTTDGGAFCWTAPDAELTLRRPARARALRLRVALPPVPRCLTITVDGVLLGCLHSEAREQVEPWQDVTFDLPAGASHQATICLSLDQPWSPAEVWQSDDARALGVALAAIAYV